MTDDDLWWAGGQFDGDGCVLVRKSDQLCIKMAKAERGHGALDKFTSLFGGKIYMEPAPKPRCQQAFTWIVTGAEARRVAGQLVERTTIKKNQLLLASQWPMMQTGQRGSPEFSTRRREIDADLRRLKKTAHEPVLMRLPHSYFAGLFDAEGCVCINAHTGSLTASVGQKYRSILDALALHYSGTVGEYKMPLWRVHGPTARLFIRDILPFSVEKLPQLHIVMGDTTADPAGIREALSAYKGRQTL